VMTRTPRRAPLHFPDLPPVGGHIRVRKSPLCPVLTGQDRSQIREVGEGGVAYGRGVEPRISIVTLGVSDLARSKAFYAALGWHGQEVQQTVFVQLGGMALVLWDRDKLAEDAGLAAGEGFGGIALAQNVRSAAEVDAVVRAAEAAGATVTRPPGETFYGGYAAYFTDPDGHPWEIAWNPGFALADDGALVLPDLTG
jgi:catechol 2,3-dioxygenase-like lactoylglutathione lyase family enzyme